MDPIAFQTKWRTASQNLKEKTASQSHFNDLCALVGVQNPIEADPIGDTYTFEKGAGKAGGGVDEQLAQRWLAEPLNPNGRPNSDVVRPWINGRDISGRPRNAWIVDFGPYMNETDAALYESPYQYVREYVKPERDLSKHRLFIWFNKSALPDSALVVFAREDDYFFGVLHSRAHEVWSLRMGTSLEDRPRYTPSTTFETFPLPWAPGTERVDDPRVVAIEDAARLLNELRENWLNPEGASEAELKKRTLTNLYNARPQWLQNAHAALDRAVWDAYGWDDPDPATVDEDTILSRLLALNGERSGG